MKSPKAVFELEFSHGSIVLSAILLVVKYDQA
jgi:hypothetical protein